MGACCCIAANQSRIVVGSNRGEIEMYRMKTVIDENPEPDVEDDTVSI